MDYANLQRIIAETDAAYAMGQSKGGDTGTWMMQNAVENRDAAIRAWQASSSSSPAPTAAASGGGSAPQPPPPPPSPLLPTFTPMSYSNNNIKVAPSDIIQFDDSTVNVAMMQDLLFEDVGATELANISRSDLIDGQDTVYSPIKNLSSVRREFNPNNVVATAYNSDFFTRFGIDLIARGLYEPYFDENGDLVIEVGSVLDGEEIQVEVLSNGTIDVIEET